MAGTPADNEQGPEMLFRQGYVLSPSAVFASHRRDALLNPGIQRLDGGLALQLIRKARDLVLGDSKEMLFQRVGHADKELQISGQVE
jgi:hypothetical protein